MAGVPSVRRARGSGILVAPLLVALGAGMPLPVAAADAEPLVLEENSLTSMVADLDGDGSSEVIAVHRHPTRTPELVVEAWTEDDGAWRSLGSVALVRWNDDTGRPDGAQFGREGVGLLSLRAGTRTRTLVATISEPTNEVGVGCCMSVSELRLAGSALHLELVEETFGSVEFLYTADIDADGYDELVAAETTDYPDVGNALVDYTLLSQAGAGFSRRDLALPSPGLSLSMAGDTDGVPGDDVLFADQTNNRLVRLAHADGELVTESAAFGSGRAFAGWPIVADDGLIGWVEERRMAMLRWPRGGEIELVAELATDEFPAAVAMSSGSDMRWIVAAGAFGEFAGDVVVRVYDRHLRMERTIRASPLSLLLREVSDRGPFVPMAGNRSVWEQPNAIPDEPRRAPSAFLGYGSLIEVGPDGRLDVRPAAHIVGAGVIGTAGAEGSWLVTAGEPWANGPFTYLGNIGYEPTYGMLGVTPLSDVMAGPIAPSVQVQGATVVVTDAGNRLYSDGEPFQLTVQGAPGDLVVAYDGVRTVSDEIVGAATTLTIEPPGRSERNTEFDLVVFVLGPTGLASAMSWPAEALRATPELTANATSEAFSLQATITGQLDGEATITVDGREVVPSPSGRFRVDVDAPIWPREVLVVATDLLGRETVQRVEVIGFVDYRGLPWIPIIGTLTVVAGIVLFVRTPRLRPEERLRPDGDARLEEIDGDLI
ncbi:MAG TPA: hypothetical protein VFP30_01495 [Candidatus Limnocylindria bacterium]|nr:hypothetical protein [Candidatus Limnocylindria bacterium]